MCVCVGVWVCVCVCVSVAFWYTVCTCFTLLQCVYFLVYLFCSLLYRYLFYISAVYYVIRLM